MGYVFGVGYFPVLVGYNWPLVGYGWVMSSL
nr:MAG TPA: hypothetical protein [Bacteriophage sp.]